MQCRILKGYNFATSILLTVLADLASFPGPVAQFFHSFSVLQAMESWAGTWNEARQICYHEHQQQIVDAQIFYQITLTDWLFGIMKYLTAGNLDMKGSKQSGLCINIIEIGRLHHLAQLQVKTTQARSQALHKQCDAYTYTYTVYVCMYADLTGTTDHPEGLG